MGMRPLSKTALKPRLQCMVVPDDNRTRPKTLQPLVVVAYRLGLPGGFGCMYKSIPSLSCKMFRTVMQHQEV